MSWLNLKHANKETYMHVRTHIRTHAHSRDHTTPPTLTKKCKLRTFELRGSFQKLINNTNDCVLYLNSHDVARKK